MMINIRKLGILLVLSAVLFLGVALLAFSYSDVGLTDIVGAEGISQSVPDLSTVPESVAEDAVELATELFGDYGDRYDDFVTQLLTTYVEARDKDFVVIFNPGGWGWNVLDSSSGWRSIFDGIETELESLGYSSLLLDYRRTGESLRGIIDEFVEVITRYPSKAKELASRVQFLTEHIPELKVIVTGESNGTIISDSVMSILRDNPRVYSIQTGHPFWHENTVLSRTLVLNSNGVTPDSFSRGDIPAMLWSSLKALFGLTPPEEEAPGRILYFMRAPGHDYRWQYPGVYSQIIDFLETNFGFNQDKY
jgi:hypothetical protein